MDTFISYSTQDVGKFEDICYTFDRDGISYWKTTEIAAGYSLRDKLQDAIGRCSLCVFIATPHSLVSRWCQAELGAFWGAGKPVIMYVADDQLREDQLPKEFGGDKFASSIPQVVAAVRSHGNELPKQPASDAIFGLATESFCDKLTLRMSGLFFGFGTLIPGGDDPECVRSTNAFGERVSYDTAKTGADATADFKALIARIARRRIESDKQFCNTLTDVFMEVQAHAQSIPHYLGEIRFGRATLAAPWRRSQETILQTWRERIKELSHFAPHELARLQEFLEAHPAYRSIDADDKLTMESFLRQGDLPVDDLIAAMRTQLFELLTQSTRGCHGEPGSLAHTPVSLGSSVPIVR